MQITQFHASHLSIYHHRLIHNVKHLNTHPKVLSYLKMTLRMLISPKQCPRD